MPNGLYSSRFLFYLFVLILFIYNGAELIGIVYIQYCVSFWLSLISSEISKINTALLIQKAAFRPIIPVTAISYSGKGSKEST